MAHSAGATIALMALTSQPSLADKLFSAILWSSSLNFGQGDLFSLFVRLRPLLEPTPAPCRPPSPPSSSKPS